MTTPTREQVVQWARESGFSFLEVEDDHEIHDTFATLARADLEATIAEQAAEIARLKEDVSHWRYQADEAGTLRVRYGKQNAELTAQRDEAMAALESIAACPGDNRLSTAIQWAKAAIAKCKEGK